MRAVMIIVVAMGLSVPCVSSAQAQADSLPPKPPRTEAEFLAHYGTSDSARALIRYYFYRKKQTSLWVVGAFGAVGLGGMLIASNDASPGKGFLGSAELAGIGVIVSSPFLMVGSASSASRFSARRLRRALEQPTSLRSKRWAEAIDYQRRYERRLARQAERDSLRMAQRSATAANLHSTAPTTAEEAQRLQEEYWRQRGGVPKPKAQPKHRSQQP